MEMTQGDHPQVPPAKPPDQGDGQQIPANGAQVICVINEAMSEDEAPMYAALEEQPTAANNVENGVSLPVTTTSDSGESGGDHVGTSDGGPEVIAQDHVGTGNRGPREAASRPAPISGSAGTLNHGPGEDAPPPYPGQEPGRPQNPRNLDKQAAKLARGHFDRSMGVLIDGIKDLAEDQHRDNLKIEANVGVNQQIIQDMMQFMTESIEYIKDSHKNLHDNMVRMESRIASIETAAENTANGAPEKGGSTDVKTLITALTEEVRRQGRSMADNAEVVAKLEGFLRENQSPMVRQDAKRKRVRAQSPTPEVIDLEMANNAQVPDQQTVPAAPTSQETPAREGTQNAAPREMVPQGTVLRDGSLATTLMGPNGKQVLRKPGPPIANNAQIPNQQAASVASTPQETPVREGNQNVAPQEMTPQGTVICNGSLATTIMGPNGKQLLRKPGPPTSGPSVTNPITGPSNNTRLLSDGNRVSTYIAEDGRETLRLPRPADRGQNQNPNGNGARPKQNTYAAAAAAPAAPKQTIPGLNHDSQRAHHSQNNRGANQGQRETNSNADKQPTKVRDDHFEICPQTGHVLRVEAYKTVPFRSEKQKGIANKRHMKDLARVMCELVLFGIPTRNKNGDIMTSAQDRLRIAKFLRELKEVGYTPTNGDVVGNVRQWRNTRHPDYIPITITFRDESTRLRVEEAALEAGLKEHRTPRAGDEEFDRIGYIRRSLSERERKELKIRNEKRNSPAGMAFAEIKRREENSRADQDDWAELNLEGDEDPEIDPPIIEQVEPAANQTEHNNNNEGSAMSAEDMLLKMQELQRKCEALQAEKEQTAAEAARARESARQTEEAAESDLEILDGMSASTGIHGPSFHRTPILENLTNFSF